MNKKRLKTSILSLVLATMILPANALAATTEINKSDLVDNQTTNNIPVECTIEANFTVKLPSAIQLTKSDDSFKFDGKVGVKGDFDAGRTVDVIPDDTVTLYDTTSRPTDDVPENVDDQAYAHKDAKVVSVTQNKTSWAHTDCNPDTYTETDLTLSVDSLTSGKWRGILNVSIEYTEPPVTLTEGEIYSFGGYNWVAAENKNGYTVLQSTGVTAGEWPGRSMAKFGNGSLYASSIDGQDISGYDDKTTALYNSIKSAEYAGADYGTGLYLVSNAMAGTTTDGTMGSGNYNLALRTAAGNFSSFGASGNNSWLGTVGSDSYAWYVNSDGNVFSYDSKDYSYVVAPAFNLDPSKVTLNGYALTVK